MWWWEFQFDQVLPHLCSFLVRHCGTLLPHSLGIATAVCIVVPQIFMAATPVGAVSNTEGNLGFIGACLNVFVTVWYIIGLIKRSLAILMSIFSRCSCCCDVLGCRMLTILEQQHRNKQYNRWKMFTVDHLGTATLYSIDHA